uniref:Uncharacterized protein n=1 Tax=Setaria italica TaxID=4555 RepID=K3YA30_SETIT
MAGARGRAGTAPSRGHGHASHSRCIVLITNKSNQRRCTYDRHDRCRPTDCLFSMHIAWEFDPLGAPFPISSRWKHRTRARSIRLLCSWGCLNPPLAIISRLGCHTGRYWSACDLAVASGHPQPCSGKRKQSLPDHIRGLRTQIGSPSPCVATCMSSCRLDRSVLRLDGRWGLFESDGVLFEVDGYTFLLLTLVRTKSCKYEL